MPYFVRSSQRDDMVRRNWKTLGIISAKLFILTYLVMAVFTGIAGYQSMRSMNPLGAVLFGITGPAVAVCNHVIESMPCSGAALIPQEHADWFFSFEGDRFYREEK